jgi:hypothetical protein
MMMSSVMSERATPSPPVKLIRTLSAAGESAAKYAAQSASVAAQAWRVSSRGQAGNQSFTGPKVVLARRESQMRRASTLCGMSRTARS